ncbi:MAG: alkaline shock response membrane anchor protein AmaP [Candidatus Omnitrophica bacterium]|nr:alkaline shock response membrane anchor protein AmaP [Candidatus Omnitrophota bacterium]MDD5027372.1 alkaline shock response membrane anchor protein AmaP [Candidatus Omnitrophota bacterium]MDD5661819.1 alkaline shock response membrane anchor protein AmaP [Candidatus Omnitrophota bacterium]
MRIFTVLGVLFYAAVIILGGIILVAFSLNLLQPQYINNIFDYIQSSPNSRIFTGLSGVILILVSFSFARIILGRLQREKTIAFDTASGEVTIALSAVEDLIRRLTGVIPEIKELRPDVIANKKGIMVDLRVILKKEANIPELTSRLQDITKSKIQEVLGVEEQITVRIHIAKIIALDEKDRNKKNIAKEEPTVPFRGYDRA